MPVRDRVLILFCGFTAGMLLLDLHKISIAIPSIDAALDPGPVRLQLVSAAYVVLFAVTLVPAGRLGDHGWRRRLALIGLYGYLVSSVVCTIAPNADTVIVGRALLGVSAGLLMPQMMGIVQGRFTGPARARAFGVYGVCVACATALGPSVGGLFLLPGMFGWRGVFAMNLPVGLVLVLAAHLLLSAVDQPRPTRRRPDLDHGGVVLLSGALVGFLLPVVLTTGRPVDSPGRWLLLVPAAALATTFVLRTRTRAAAGRSPLISPALLALPSFRNGVLISATWFAAVPGASLALTIYLQQVEHLSPLLAGLVLLPAAVGSAVGADIGGRTVTRWGRRLTALGMTLTLLAMAAVVVLLHGDLPGTALLAAVSALQLVSGVGTGMVVSPNHAQMLADVPPAQGSAAGAVGQLGQRVANSFGVAAASVAYFTVIYGGGWSVSDAPPAAHLGATLRATAVAMCFLLASLAVALVDLRRQRAGDAGRAALAIRGDRPAGRAGQAGQAAIAEAGTDRISTSRTVSTAGRMRQPSR
ncbi:MFS transporter [Georgenia sp. Z1491]|uniref:MFS transporter n=1 Tax=Georgenia sp. Z1491 TaxID=3416707 RepID=UPI003CEBEE6F